VNHNTQSSKPRLTSPSRPGPSRPGPSRRGAVMVFALIALLVASLMIASLLRTASMSHRQLKRDEFRIQASLLADAGCQRAIWLLRKKPDWATDEWEIPEDQLAPGRTASVRLSITKDPSVPDRRIVIAIADFPVGHSDRVRVTRQRSVP